MSLSEILLALLGAATMPLAGLVWVALRPRSPGILGSRGLEAMTVGPTLTILALVLAYSVGLGPRTVSVVVFTLAAFCLIRRTSRRALPLRGEVLRATLLCVPVLVAFSWTVSTAPLTGDPAELWASKAAAFKHAGALDLSPLGPPDAIVRRNPFHPVGFPLLMDQALAWLPRFEPMLCRIPSVWFLLLLVVLADRSLSGVLSPWYRVVPVLALAFLPPVIEQGFDGHADLALGTTLLASWLAMGASARPELAGLLAGGAALLKLEGAAGPLVGATLLAAKRRWRELFPFAGCAIIPLLVARLVLPSGAGSTGPGLLDPRLYLEHSSVLAERIAFIATEGWTIVRGISWPLLAFGGILLAAALVPGAARKTSRQLLATSGLWLLCVSSAYLLHPQFEFQVKAHQRRAFLQVLPALWIAGSIGLFQRGREGCSKS